MDTAASGFTRHDPILSLSTKPGQCIFCLIVRLQLLAAATVINLKRLLAAQDGAGRGQTGELAARAAAVFSLTGFARPCPGRDQPPRRDR